jgi:hypothetical protein
MDSLVVAVFTDALKAEQVQGMLKKMIEAL